MREEDLLPLGSSEPKGKEASEASLCLNSTWGRAVAFPPENGVGRARGEEMPRFQLLAFEGFRTSRCDCLWAAGKGFGDSSGDREER